MSIFKNTLTTNTQQELIKAGCLIYCGSTPAAPPVAISGRLFTVGDSCSGLYGTLGDNTNIRKSSPVQIPGTWISVGGDDYNGFAVKSDNTLWAWGGRYPGVLADNISGFTSASSPQQIPGTTWCCVSGGGFFGAALKTDGTLWGWGSSGAGQLGNSCTVNRSSPIQIPGTTWCFIQTAEDSIYAIKSDNTMWNWGFNSFGNLGIGNELPSSSPIQIPGTTWCKVVSDNFISAALKTDGTLWTMGRNTTGQLGQNDAIARSSPIQVPGTTWCDIGTRTYGFLAVKSDGTLWSWGSNTSGIVGDNTTIPRSSPVQIPGTTWTRVVTDGGDTSPAAIKSDNTQWAWGPNLNGSLGLNDTIARSSPTQIPGSWALVAQGQGNWRAMITTT